MALEDGVQTLIDQTSLEVAHSRFAKAVQDAGYTAVEVTNTSAFMSTMQGIAARTVADADANATAGTNPLLGKPAPSWSEQVHEKVRQLAALGDDTVMMETVKQNLKEGLEYVTSKSDWDAATAWIATELTRLVDEGVIRRTEPTTDSGKVEFILSDMTEDDLK